MVVKIYNYEQIMQNKGKFNEVFEYIKMYGVHTMSYSILQPKMNYFILEGVGIIAYAKLKKNSKTRFVLGDPLVSRDHLKYLLKIFLSRYKKACFLQVSDNTAKILYDSFNYQVNILGTETIIDMNIESRNEQEVDKSLYEELNSLEEEKDKLYKNMSDPKIRKDFWFVKKKVQNLRNKIKKLEEIKSEEENKEFSYYFLEKEGMKFLRREITLAEKSSSFVKEINNGEINIKILEEISKEWLLNNKLSSDEMTFLTRPFKKEELFMNYKRLFIVGNENQVYGFLELTPLFLNNKIIGYYADLIRSKKNIPPGTINYLIIKSMNKLYSEGFRIYSLGLSPFHKVNPIIINKKIIKHRIDNKLSTLAFKVIFNYGSFLYNAKGQAFHKEKYGAPMVETFYCSKKKIQFLEIIGGFFICNLNPIKSLNKLLKNRNEL